MRLAHVVLACSALALSWTATARATPGSYGAASGYTITPPYDPDSFTTVLDAFPASSVRLVDGYPLASRLLAATGRTVFLLQTFGRSDWLPVAVLAASDPAMDPSFLTMTSDGEKIALGTGLNKPLYVFPTLLLSVASPVVLTTSAQAHRYDLNYYSAAFRGSRYLFVDAGGAQLGESYIYAIDTDSSANTVLPIIGGIPGASSGIAFDAAGDLVAGIGWNPNSASDAGSDADAGLGSNGTGDLKIFNAASIDAVLAGGPSLDYEADGQLLATGILSADSLGFDSAGNLDVGGGDVFGTSGHYGYANVINGSVISRVLSGGAPADSTNPNEVATVAPDPCKNDDWTGVTYVSGVDMLLVSANLATLPPNCASVDWSTGPEAIVLYFPPGAPLDSDGIPAGADPNYEPQQLFGRAQLSRLVNALDAKAADPNFDATVDYDGDGTIDDADFTFLRAHWGQPLPG